MKFFTLKMLFLMFVMLKLCDVIDWNWFLVILPILIVGVLQILLDLSKKELKF